MGFTHIHLQELFKDSFFHKDTALSLPAYKKNGLEIFCSHSQQTTTIYNGKPPPLPFVDSDTFRAKISRWRKLTSDNNEDKATYEVTFDIKGSNFKFNPGDTIGLIPYNTESEVNAIIKQLDLSATADIGYVLTANSSVKGCKIPLHIPVQSSLRYVLTHCVDVRSTVKKLFLLALSKHTSDAEERKVLEYLCSKEGSAMYNTHILDKHYCITDLLNIFRSCKPPIEILLAHLPRLLPRPYSIANSQLKNDSILKICFSVIKIGNRKGLTTGYLEDLILNGDNIESCLKNISLDGTRNNNEVTIYLRKNMNRFRLPKDISKALLLIGPGTGVAPFIGFLEERAMLKERDSTLKLGDTWLFFGCRTPHIDNLYENELNEFLVNGALAKLSTSFSRVENNGVKYVQDAIRGNAEEIAKFIKSGATIFVCGDLKTMAVNVRDALKHTLQRHGDVSDEEADKYIANMETDKRYNVDIWS